MTPHEKELVKVLVKGKNSKLLKEASELTKRMEEVQRKASEKAQKAYKKYQPEIDELRSAIDNIKAKLGPLADGDYFNKSGNTVLVRTIISYTHPTVEDTKELLKKKRKGRLFYSIVKVQLGELKKILTDEEIQSLREEEKRETKYTFK